MSEISKYEKELKDTGYVYGYFTLKTSESKHAEVQLNCEIPLLKSEYLTANAEISKINTILKFTEIVADYTAAHSDLTVSINKLNSSDYDTLKSVQKATESFIESTVRTVTRFKRELKKSYDNNMATIFENEVSGIYDNGASYALLYKLRNVYQHEGTIPLKLNREIEKDGLPHSRIHLDSAKMLQNPISSYLNAKVKSYVSNNPSIDVYSQAKEVFEQLVALMQSYIGSRLINTDLIKTTSSYIDIFLQLNNPNGTIFLTKLKEVADDKSHGFDMTQTQISLEYVCKLVSNYLITRSGILFSYWGEGLNENKKAQLPGIYDVLCPDFYNYAGNIIINENRYSQLQRTLALTEPMPEFYSMLQRVDVIRPDEETLNLYWTFYEKLISGLKLQMKVDEPAAVETVPESSTE